MKKALAGVLAVVMTGVLAGSAMAQVPNVQVYFDPAHTQTQTSCGTQGQATSLYVVANNWNMNIAGIDFSIAYPPSLVWVVDVLPDPTTQVSIGFSPTGIAIGYANCCPLNGFQSVEVLRPFVVWGPCDCSPSTPGNPQNVVVGGANPDKPNPSAVRKEDFVEFPGVGMTSLICPGVIATEPTTWGQVKALYR